MTTGLSFLNVGRHFGKQTALEGLELRCPAGAMTCLVGPNGAGKSTALALAAGLLAPTSGKVIFNRREVVQKVPPDSTGYLPQHSAFHPSLSVDEVLDFALAARGMATDKGGQALEVTGLGEVLGRFVGELSGGWVRRLGLLSALLGSPKLLLLDEPFVGLDPETHDRLVGHLEDRLDSGDTLVVTSHEFEVLDRFGPRVAVLDEGRLRLIEAVISDGSDTSGRTSVSSRTIYRQALGAEPVRGTGDSD